MSSNRLFKPMQIGHMQLRHRISMAPLTRFRSDAGHVPGPYVKEYYEQRGSVPGTLLVSEATLISPQASGYKHVPGIWNDAHVAAWKEVTDAVHAKGSFIFCQLWALGRVADPQVLQDEGGFSPVSSSAVAVGGKTSTGAAPGVPRALTEDEIQSFIADYAKAAANAIRAGFDGVELHAANGYLIDQFTQDVVNQRTDKWGGSIENRARFALEATKAVIDAVGDRGKVGIRLAPWYSGQGMGMEKPIPQYLYLTKKLRELDLAYLHLVERRTDSGPNPADAIYNTVGNSNAELIEAWCTNGKPLLLAGGLTPETAGQLVNEIQSEKEISAVFGRYFIANPDLVFRIEQGIQLSKWNRETFYKAESPDGYVDIPFSTEWTSTESRL